MLTRANSLRCGLVEREEEDCLVTLGFESEVRGNKIMRNMFINDTFSSLLTILIIPILILSLRHARVFTRHS